MVPGVLLMLLVILGFFLWCQSQSSQPREYGGAGGFGVIGDLDEDTGYYIRA